jgi:hypothetical protein
MQMGFGDTEDNFRWEYKTLPIATAERALRDVQRLGCKLTASVFTQTSNQSEIADESRLGRIAKNADLHDLIREGACARLILGGGNTVTFYLAVIRPNSAVMARTAVDQGLSYMTTFVDVMNFMSATLERKIRSHREPPLRHEG